MYKRIMEGETTYKDAIRLRIIQAALVIIFVLAIVGWIK